jgi:hypothetical protein
MGQLSCFSQRNLASPGSIAEIGPAAAFGVRLCRKPNPRGFGPCGFPRGPGSAPGAGDPPQIPAAIPPVTRAASCYAIFTEGRKRSRVSRHLGCLQQYTCTHRLLPEKAEPGMRGNVRRMRLHGDRVMDGAVHKTALESIVNRLVRRLQYLARRQEQVCPQPAPCSRRHGS